MSIVPDVISHEALEKVIFSILGALISGVSGIGGWVGHVITQWWLHRRRTASSIMFVQDSVSGINLWSRTKVGDREIMQLSAHFRITNNTDHPVFITRITTGFWRLAVIHPRVIVLNPDEEVITENPVPPKSTRNATISFELAPPRNWHGSKKLSLFLTDSLGNERRIRATFRPHDTR